MYHAALTEQVEREREEVRSAEAVRLGEPVIVTRVPAQKSSEEGNIEGGSEISSEMSFEDGKGEGAGMQEAGGNEGDGGGDDGQGSGERGGRLLHSTRASSGVFPEGRESRDEEDEGEVDEERIYS